MSGAIYNKQNITVITDELITDLKHRALVSSRKRFRFCLHQSNADQTQEMIIVFRQNTFMPPHRHPMGKSESYHIIEGSMKVFIFNNKGYVTRIVELGEAGQNKAFMYRLSSNFWHMPVAISEWLVYHEAYSGPFKKEIDVEFPAWAPRENDKLEVKKFLQSLDLRSCLKTGK